jgi:hypothetical protein
MSEKNLLVQSIVRGEEHIERWATFLFPPQTKTQNLKESRKHRFTAIIPGGEIPAEIILEPSGALEEDILDKEYEEGKGTVIGAFNSKTYDVYLALVQIWAEKGKPLTEFNISIKQICDAMGVSAGGRKNNEVILDLARLRVTHIHWVYSFISKDQELREHENMTILSKFSYVSLSKRKDKNRRFDRNVTVKFDDLILNNLLNRRTIPVNWTARKSIRSPIAKSLYNQIDNILTSTGKPYSRLAKNLVKDLHLFEKNYKAISQREKLVDGLKTQLEGKPLSNFSTVHVEVSLSSDESDWKCTFTSRKRVELLDRPRKNMAIVNSDEEIKYLTEYMLETVGTPENKKLFERFSRHYSHDLIHRACGEFKENAKSGIKSYGAYFTSVVHRLSHEANVGWINHCEPNSNECKYNKETEKVIN